MKHQNSQFYRVAALGSCLSLLLAVQLHLVAAPTVYSPAPPPSLHPSPGGQLSSAPPLAQPTVTPPPESPAANVRVSSNSPPAQPPPAPSPRPQYEYRALLTSSGPLYSNQPFLNRIAATAAWQTFANTNSAPVIAVIDTGFALDHDTLKNRWSTDKPGWDFVHNDSDPRAGTTNPNGAAVTHGTLTAGLASILNPNARLMPLQALSDEGIGYTDGVGAAIRYAADNGADVISLSLGSDTDDPYLQQQVDYAIAKGVVVLAAAGNDGCDCMVYPARYPEVIAVGASTNANTTASFSSYGANLDVLAPGTAGDVCSA
ncbi:MAG TPA: S8 family serine peptidase, partial [Candidatus Polarisedimenticolaceae bacterium]|nr:S8 family serine peptidase [Candidatus Polarisedimenticolaceae bacterium]